MSAPVTNWAGNVIFHARAFHRPSSLAELQKSIASAETVRALGTGHSFNPLADTEGDQVSVAGLPIEVDVDSAARQARVSAGLRFGELNPLLHAAGMALHNLGSLPHISLAGACATGTHGSGVTNANIASAVAALEMVTATGDVITLERGDKHFAGAVVGLGALGVISRITLDVVPSFQMRQYVFNGLAWDRLEQDLAEVLAGAYSVSIFTDWTGGSSQVWLKHRMDAGVDVDEVVPRTWLGASLAEVAHHPVPGMPTQHATQQLGVPGPSHERLPHFRLDFTPSTGAELQTEYLLPAEHGPTALAALAPIRDQIAAVLQIGEIRAIAADELWLSPSYQRQSVALHFTWVPDIAAVRPVLLEIEDRLAPFAARPHWGKVFSVEAPELARLYPRYADFQALMTSMDPGGKFRNAEIDHYFPQPG